MLAIAMSHLAVKCADRDQIQCISHALDVVLLDLEPLVAALRWLICRGLVRECLYHQALVYATGHRPQLYSVGFSIDMRSAGRKGVRCTQEQALAPRSCP
jgi:hypothetical protein